jgi:hypothetical protein
LKDKEMASAEILHNVHLLIKETPNILVVEPANLPTSDTEKFLVTLQHVLTRSIQAVYKLEDNELGSERLGQGRTLLFWEAAEGGAGVLSQLLDDEKAFQAIAQTALEICHFIEAKDECVQACYECLLSYSNQFDHALIDRHLTQGWLNQLLDSKLQRPQSEMVDREKHYNLLKQQIDPNSRLEALVLEEIYCRDLPLPDTAQELILKANIKPDFLYKAEKIAVFCDGSVHDSPDKQNQDRIERDNLKYHTGYRVLALRHDEDWQSKLNLLNN